MKPLNLTRLFKLLLLLVIVTTTHAQIPLWKTIPTPPALPTDDKSGFISLGDAKMYYAVYNEMGEAPVILIHGGLGSSDDWGFELPLLMKMHKVIVVDCRGRGRSTMGTKPLSYWLMTNDLIAMMNLLSLNSASVIGISDGGIIGLLMAIHFPKRINKLVAFGANYSRKGYKTAAPDTVMMQQYLALMKKRYKKISPTPTHFAQMLSLVEKMYAKEPEIPEADLQKITAPTLIADGQYEQFIKLSHTKRLAQLIPNARLVILPNVSHGGAAQAPKAFHRMIKSFLNN